MNKYIILAVLCFLTHYSYSQIAINTESPHSSAELDIVGKEKKGVLVPRLTTTDKEAITNPASGLLVYDIDKKCLSQNVGSEGAPVWICMVQDATRFFYMPSINIPTPQLGVAAAPLDLYAEYKKQFAAPYEKNGAAPSVIAHYSDPTDLYYYITYYDKDVLSISSISDDGKMSYSVLRKADYDTYMNVVFVVK